MEKIRASIYHLPWMNRHCKGFRFKKLTPAELGNISMKKRIAGFLRQHHHSGASSMRYSLMVVGLTLALNACSHWFVDPYPDLVETEKQLVQNCALLGVVAETADAANPFSAAAGINMVLRVRERAGQLGATHLVWLHQTDTMATAEAYRCPQ